MIYAKRFGAFMPIVTLLTSLIVTYFLYPWTQGKWPLYWRGNLIALALLILALSWCLVYVGNLVLIRFSKSPEFSDRLSLRWRSVLTDKPDPAPIQDFLDRVADLQVKISHPDLSRLKETMAHAMTDSGERIAFISGRDLLYSYFTIGRQV